MNKNTKIYKIVLLGQYCVGKSSLIKMYCNKEFNEYTESTIGAAYFSKYVQDKDIKLECWDTAGQERYSSLSLLYYRNSGAAIIIYDITNFESFEKAKLWVDEIKNFNSKIYIAFVGNKSDLEDKRVVSIDEALSYAGNNDIFYIETSAKEDSNIDDLMENISNYISPDLSNNKSIEISKVMPQKKKICCF